MPLGAVIKLNVASPLTDVIKLFAKLNKKKPLSVEKVAGEMEEILFFPKDTATVKIVCAEAAAVVLKLNLPLRELI